MELPLLLAGPIIRRAEPECFYIWLATSRPVQIEAKAFIPNPSTGNKDELREIGANSKDDNCPETVRLGENLFVSLLAIKPTGDKFPLDQIIYYDILLDGKSLNEQGLTDGEHSLAYEGHPLPGFFLPSQINHLLHGSCRKLHGPGGDTLASADAVLAGSFEKLQDRPAVLFLTGDQIYGDDVAGPLIKHLTRLGEAITGWQEFLPDLGTTTDIPLYGRAKLLKSKKSGLTSMKAGNHLLTFGEYAAMYLVAWNPLVWPKAMPDDEPQLDEKKKKKIHKELQALGKARQTMSIVRRVLANIPTYMILDDHEVTDDWNLGRRWHTRVRESDLGRRIVANALAAYWAFQGWGNAPDSFPAGFINIMLKHLMARESDPPGAKRFDQYLWSFHRWGYYVPTNPPVIVLNTRTQREYQDEGESPDLFDLSRIPWFGTFKYMKTQEPPARLIDRYGIDWLRVAWADLGEPKDKRLILISPAPVYGFEPYENVQKFLVSMGASPTLVDQEAWIANREGYTALMRCLNHEFQLNDCLILSGDVHYAFSTIGKFNSDGRTLNVIQLTSSALKNQPSKGDFIEWVGKLSKRTEFRMGWKPYAPLYWRPLRPLLEMLVRWNLWKIDTAKRPLWTDEVSGKCAEGQKSLIVSENNLGLVCLNDSTCPNSVRHDLLMGPTPGPEKITFEL